MAGVSLGPGGVVAEGVVVTGLGRTSLRMIWLRVFVKALEVKSVFFIIDLGGGFAAAAHHAGICAGVRNAVIHDLAFNFDEEDLLLLQADGGFADFGEERAETAVEPACKLREIRARGNMSNCSRDFAEVLEQLVVFVFGFLANAAGVQGNERHGRKRFLLSWTCVWLARACSFPQPTGGGENSKCAIASAVGPQMTRIDADEK